MKTSKWNKASLEACPEWTQQDAEFGVRATSVSFCGYLVKFPESILALAVGYPLLAKNNITQKEKIMSTQEIQKAPPAGGQPHPHVVQVTIDGRDVDVPSGEYIVAELKLKLGVPAEYELENIKHGTFHPLADNSVFKVRHDEEFISHVRTGSSSWSAKKGWMG
jgi:hypothetical protein